MPFPFPYLYCPKCKERTPFPYPNREEPTSHQQRLPSDTWRIYLVCWNCVQLSLMTAKDVRMFLPDRVALHRWDVGPSFFRVRHKCAHEDCGALVTVFVSTTKTHLAAREADAIIQNSFPRPLCPNDHVFQQQSPIDSVVEVFSLL